MLYYLLPLAMGNSVTLYINIMLHVKINNKKGRFNLETTSYYFRNYSVRIFKNPRTFASAASGKIVAPGNTALISDANI